MLIKNSGKEFKIISVARDGVTLVVNKKNPVDSLSLQQLKKIYSGQIVNWKFVNGKDQNIVLYSRENSSGTYEFFKQKILTKNEDGIPVDFSTNIQLLQGTSAVAQAVSSDENGIGYGGIGYFASRNDIKVLKIRSSENEKNVLSRKLFCYINKNSNPEVIKFINFLNSGSGQALIKESGFIPLNNDE